MLDITVKQFQTPPFNNIQENAKRMITVWAGKASIMRKQLYLNISRSLFSQKKKHWTDFWHTSQPSPSNIKIKKKACFQ